MQSELEHRGGRLIAIAVDTPEQSRKVVTQRRLNFSILADTQHQVITEYGLVHHGAGPHGSDVAIPAHVLIDRDGRIAWRHVARRVQDRPDRAEDLEAIRKLVGS